MHFTSVNPTLILVCVFTFALLPSLLGFITLFLSPKRRLDRENRKVLKKWLNSIGAVYHGYEKEFYCIFDKDKISIVKFKLCEKDALHFHSCISHPPIEIFEKLHIRHIAVCLKSISPTP